eukprot:6100357-Pyramimonas_sp.AAC.1
MARCSWPLLSQEGCTGPRHASYSESSREAIRPPYQTAYGLRRAHTHTDTPTPRRARILDGKTVAAEWAEKSKQEVEKLKREHGIVPGLAVRRSICVLGPP